MRDRFEREHPEPDIVSIAADAFIDRLKRGESSNDVATKFFEKGQLIRERIKQEEKLWEEARDKLLEETKKPLCEATEDRHRLIEQLSDCKAATLAGVCAKTSAVDFDALQGGEDDELSLLKSIFADIQVLSA